jgi:serine/threonine protein kinase
LSNGCVTDDLGTIGDYKLIKILGKGTFGQVILAKNRLKAACNSGKDLFALKQVAREKVSEVEKEVLLATDKHPFIIELIEYLESKVSCSFRHSISVH